LFLLLILSLALVKLLLPLRCCCCRCAAAAAAAAAAALLLLLPLRFCCCCRHHFRLFSIFLFSFILFPTSCRSQTIFLDPIRPQMPVSSSKIEFRKHGEIQKK
jgi:hypothetical protein